MKEIIPRDSLYIPLVQQRWCCVPACISMVMHRHGIPLVSQELLGFYLGVVVPKEDVKLFWNVKTGRKPSSGWGTRMSEKRFNPNSMFRKLHVPLEMAFHPIGSFLDMRAYKKYLSTIEEQEKDVLACFSWGALYNKPYRGGHVCVIDRVDIRRDEIRLIDPEYDAPKWRTVSIEKLKMAMESHGKKEGGFWEFIKI
ncbi:MAG: hypothetical protein HY001_03695 [Candidatus Portnoybacteria bacterium]|nr:hypothetical protein [Candidatus Portnoybacteria bacterium]